MCTINILEHDVIVQYAELNGKYFYFRSLVYRHSRSNCMRITVKLGGRGAKLASQRLQNMKNN